MHWKLLIERRFVLEHDRAEHVHEGVRVLARPAEQQRQPLAYLVDEAGRRLPLEDALLANEAL
jgi:hypothetical protein